MLKFAYLLPYKPKSTQGCDFISKFSSQSFIKTEGKFYDIRKLALLRDFGIDEL